MEVSLEFKERGDDGGSSLSILDTDAQYLVDDSEEADDSSEESGSAGDWVTEEDEDESAGSDMEQNDTDTSSEEQGREEGASEAGDSEEDDSEEVSDSGVECEDEDSDDSLARELTSLIGILLRSPAPAVEASAEEAYLGARAKDVATAARGEDE